MKHITMDEWVKYVTDDIDESTRSEYEMHLYNCDYCMDSYMQAIKLAENDLPTVTNSSEYTEEIIRSTAEINGSFEKQGPKRVIRKRWCEQKLVHYALAVVMTLLLMTTGVFTQLTEAVSKFEKSNQPSLTESLMNKTTSLINQVEEETKEVE
jgi:predicted anti-sigma-YlaC factor YlaD